jgi:hypothetical protein
MQVAAWVLDIFSKFYLMKNHKISMYQQQPPKLPKITHRCGILRILEFGAEFVGSVNAQACPLLESMAQPCKKLS